MTPKEYTAAMSKNPLWRLMQTKAYKRGLEMKREREIQQSIDDGDFDDDIETHQRRETLTPRELI